MTAFTTFPTHILTQLPECSSLFTAYLVHTVIRTPCHSASQLTYQEAVNSSKVKTTPSISEDPATDQSWLDCH